MMSFCDNCRYFITSPHETISVPSLKAVFTYYLATRGQYGDLKNKKSMYEPLMVNVKVKNFFLSTKKLFISGCLVFNIHQLRQSCVSVAL